MVSSIDPSVPVIADADTGYVSISSLSNIVAEIFALVLAVPLMSPAP